MGGYGMTTTNYSSIPAANLVVTINGNVSSIRLLNSEFANLRAELLRDNLKI